MKKVLITGMSGLIGGILRRHLESRGGYRLSALNRSPVEGVPCHQADISDPEAIKPAFAGQDVVVHLAGKIGEESWEATLNSNLIGVYNVLEASRLAGVKRVVFASSGSTVRGFETGEPYKALVEGRYDEVPETWPMVTHEVVCPKGLYSASKVWGEAICRHYAATYGLSVLCLRLGIVTADDRPHGPRQRALYLSHRDAAQALHLSIEAPESLSYEVFFAMSNNRWNYRDVSHARDVVGFVPRDSAEAAIGNDGSAEITRSDP